MSVDLVVVWDGRKLGPGGAYLFADGVSTEQAKPAPAHGALTARLRELAPILKLEFLTTRQIAELAGMSMDQASAAVHGLALRGVMEREHEAQRGRHAGQRYRWAR